MIVRLLLKIDGISIHSHKLFVLNLLLRDLMALFSLDVCISLTLSFEWIS